MARPPLPLLRRLLPKIQAPGPIDTLIGAPIDYWPDLVRTLPWRWIGATARPRVAFSPFYAHRFPERPSFKIDGHRVPVHKLVYELFLGQVRSLRYYVKPADFMDVNPAHWSARHRPAQAQDQIEVFDEALNSLVELLEERAATKRPLLLGLEDLYTPEQIAQARAITQL